MATALETSTLILSSHFIVGLASCSAKRKQWGILRDNKWIFLKYSLEYVHYLLGRYQPHKRKKKKTFGQFLWKSQLTLPEKLSLWGSFSHAHVWTITGCLARNGTIGLVPDRISLPNECLCILRSMSEKQGSICTNKMKTKIYLSQHNCLFSSPTDSTALPDEAAVSIDSIAPGLFKGPLCSFGEGIQSQTLYTHNNNEVLKQYSEIVFFFHNWMNKLFSEEDKVPRTLFEAGQVMGSATGLNKVKQNETVFYFKVSLFIQSWEQREFSVLSKKKKTVCEDLSPLTISFLAQNYRLLLTFRLILNCTLYICQSPILLRGDTPAVPIN